jgi:hypothetical protein
MNKHTLPDHLLANWHSLVCKIPSTILTSNAKLRADGIHNITLPALTATVIINGAINQITTCPNAGTCKAVCYAKGGCYNFDSCKIKHNQNIQLFINDKSEFIRKLINEVAKVKKGRKPLRAIRFHDSGDFFNLEYWDACKKIILASPTVNFYAYSKMVGFFKKLYDSNEVPNNFHVIYSLGGTEDHLINLDTDRHARIFSSRKALRDAGYSDGTHTDRLAASGKFLKIGLVVHRNPKEIPKLRKIVAKW